LRKSGITMTVPQGVSVIDAALARGVDIAQQCRNGVCGTCQTRLVEGEVEHHDMYLEADERERFMMPCVSRAPAGGRIVLDL
jgi:ferredoxin